MLKMTFEKDYFKQMKNAVFGKTMEKVRNRVEIKCAFDEEYHMKYTLNPNYHSSKDYKNDDKYFMFMKLEKKTA